jgi:hypothetical protein
MMFYGIMLYLHNHVNCEDRFKMKTKFKSDSNKLIQDSLRETAPSTSVEPANMCYNCGVTVVSDEGDWCWECVMVMHDN